MASPIRIRIDKNDSRTSISNKELSVESVGMPTTNSSAILRSVGANQLINFGIQSGKQLINNSISQYGNMTGDYLTQSRIEGMISTGSNIVSVGGSIVSGFMVGGIVGAGVGAVLSLGSMAVNTYIQDKNYTLANRRANQQISFNNALVGNILVDGNR